MLQKKMEGMAMVMMTQMTEFMKQYIILQNQRQAYYIKIKIDVASGRATAPIGSIMLDGNPVIYEAISGSEDSKPLRQHGLGLPAQSLDLLI